MDQVKFKMKDGNSDKVTINHGPYELEFVRDKGPWDSPADVWDRVIKPTGYFEKVGSDQEAKPLPEKEADTPIDNVEIYELKYNEAIEEVNACNDLNQLEVWRENESRKTVLEAITKRRTELEAENNNADGR
jgi:hypothetical protein